MDVIKEIKKFENWLIDYLNSMENYIRLTNTNFTFLFNLHTYIPLAFPPVTEYGPQFCTSYHVHFIKMKKELTKFIEKRTQNERATYEAFITSLDPLFLKICPPTQNKSRDR